MGVRLSAPVVQRSGTNEAGDCFRGFLDLLGRVVAALGQRLAHAVPEVLLEQAERDRLQGLGRRRHLSEDVDAVLVLLDHPLQAPYLALDAAQAPKIAAGVVGVTVHDASRVVPGSPCGGDTAAAEGCWPPRRPRTGSSRRRRGWASAGPAPPA